MLVRWRGPILWAALVWALPGGPADAATFKCGKVFVTFQGKEGDYTGIITVRKSAIVHVLTSTNRGFSGVVAHTPGGKLQTVNIDQATHNRLIVCLN